MVLAPIIKKKLLVDKTFFESPRVIEMRNFRFRITYEGVQTYFRQENGGNFELGPKNMHINFKCYLQKVTND